MAKKAKKSKKSCAGINKSTGKLKKGYKYKKGSNCPVKVAKKAPKKARKTRRKSRR